MKRRNTTIAACFLILSLICCSAATAAIIINHTATDLSQIPDQWISQAKSDLHIAYQHTSHGSQLITGMDALQSYPDFETNYSWTDDGTAGTLDLDDYGIPGCEDLSQGDSVDFRGDTPWVIATRTLLDNSANSHVNVVAWSWCSINSHNAQRYVDNMEKLIGEYPDVQFVFMTGHAEGQGEDITQDSVHYNNQLIRNHCAANNRILFDFADIEAYNPGGTYFWDKDMYDNLNYTGGNWAVQWIAANPAHELTKLTTGTTGYSGCSGCVHSDSPTQANLNCVLKGRAAWWLWARLAGWSGPDGSSTTTTTISGTSTTTTVKRFHCPAADVLGDDNENGLSALRDLRDRRLATTVTGRIFIILYYMHARELTALLYSNSAIRSETRELLEIFLQRQSSCYYGTCLRVISEDELLRIDMLLGNIEPLASPWLRMSIAFARKIIDTNELLPGLIKN